MTVMTEWQEAWLSRQTLLVITIFSVIVVPLTVVLSGSIIPALVAFPLGVLGTLYFTTFGIPLIMVSFFQFFIYGTFLKRAARRGRLYSGLAKVIVFHFLVSSGMAAWITVSLGGGFTLHSFLSRSSENSSASSIERFMIAAQSNSALANKLNSTPRSPFLFPFG